MKTILVTGSAGFIGRHVCDALARRTDVKVIACHRGRHDHVLNDGLKVADIIIHLAGVNRPSDPAEFAEGNTEFTCALCSRLAGLGRKPVLVFSSSIQAAQENPYGLSKRRAEAAIEAWAEAKGGRAIIFRLKNVFGKWCRPNYNSVTATFCHNIAHDLPISISDPARELELAYIDDVAAALVSCVDATGTPGIEYRQVQNSYRITLGELAGTIRSFRESRRSLLLPSFETELVRRLYATYLSYLEHPNFAYRLESKTDPRGTLAEFMKSSQFGQIFVSRTGPGVTRGNHYHHTKTEKFLVLEGEAIVRFRHVAANDVFEYRVRGSEFTVVDIPPGYTHSIENIGDGELITVFWASEIFDAQRPDTTLLPVQQGAGEFGTR